MKPFKLIAFVMLLTVSAFTITTYTACKDACADRACLNGGACQDGKCICPSGFLGDNCEKTLCTDVECKNGGVCKDGNCECAAGYSGTNCETLMAEKFLGKWYGVDDCNFGGWPDFTWNVEMGVTKADVVIHGWWSSTGVRGVMKSATEITIPSQVYNTYGDLISGSVNYNNGILNVSFELDGRSCYTDYKRP